MHKMPDLLLSTRPTMGPLAIYFGGKLCVDQALYVPREGKIPQSFPAFLRRGARATSVKLVTRKTAKSTLRQQRLLAYQWGHVQPHGHT